MVDGNTSKLLWGASQACFGVLSWPLPNALELPFSKLYSSIPNSYNYKPNEQENCKEKIESFV